MVKMALQRARIWITEVPGCASVRHETSPHPEEIFPPVCLEWPLLNQLKEGKGWPDP